MSDFSDSELRRIDLTLLLVLLGLLRHRKAAAVADELGLTQSAISQALKRLRDIFGDPLFLRRPHGMDPTATALALEAPVGQAVEALRGAIGIARRFDPVEAQGIVRIAALDAEQAVLVPALAGRLRDTAPGAPPVGPPPWPERSGRRVVRRARRPVARLPLGRTGLDLGRTPL